MKIAMITGLTGFVGSHVARELAREGWTLVGLKRSTSSLKALDGMPGLLTFHDVDQHPPACAFELLPDPVGAVIHVATNLGRSVGPDGRSVDTAPGSGMDSQVLHDNVVFPLRLLEETIARRVPLFINTDTCIPEFYPAMRPYALSKRHFLTWGKTLCAGTDTKFVNLRLCQPYGPRERPAMFIPWLIRECFRGGEIPLTLGQQRRDFIYASDVATAYTCLLDAVAQLPAFGHFDCGFGGAGVSIREFVTLVHRLTHSHAKLRFGALPYRCNEISWVADNAPLRALGWFPKTALETGLRTYLLEEFGAC
jgi:CDP-paratose synthetase